MRFGDRLWTGCPKETNVPLTQHLRQIRRTMMFSLSEPIMPGVVVVVVVVPVKPEKETP